MINMFEVNETNNMITQEKLDVRTITTVSYTHLTLPTT